MRHPRAPKGLNRNPRTFLSASLIALVLAATITAEAEPITTAEAQTALRNAQRASAEPGCFRQETVRKHKGGTTTTTTLTARPPSGRSFSRTESTTVIDGHPEKTRTTLTFVNADGRWRVIGKTAVLLPPQFEAGKIIDQMNRAAVGSAGPVSTPAGGKDKDAELATKAIALAAHVHLAGERVTEGDRELIRVTRTYDDEARKFIADLADEQFAAMKKQLSFGKRVVLSAFLATQGGIEGMMPAREVFTIDVATNRIIKSETYKASGKLLNSRPESKPPERIADLPLETFALPAGVETVRPKTFVEAMELTEKLQKQESQHSTDDV